MIRQIWNALIFKNTWALNPAIAIALLGFIVFNGWRASPYFMHYVVKDPPPGSYPRYTGEVTIHKVDPPRRGSPLQRYILATANGEVELFCGSLPHKLDCPLRKIFHANESRMVTIGFHNFWGIDSIEWHSPEVRARQKPDARSFAMVSRSNSLDLAKTPLVLFFATLFIYVSIVLMSLYMNSSNQIVAKFTDSPD
jgi:hypothetical protein